MGRSAFARKRGLLCAVAATALCSAFAVQAAQTTQYTYDALGRVLSAIDSDGKKVVYSYDAAGNRTRVSNGAEFSEINPTAWSASSNAGTTGLTATNGMKDGGLTALASIHATQTETNAWVMADLGTAKTVNHIDIAPALASSVGASPADLDDTVVEFSVDGTKWSTAATISGVSPGATRTIALGGVSARYIRIRRAMSGQVALGDLRLFSAAAANSPLIAEPDSITTSGSAVTFDPRTNDQDLDGYPFTITSVEDPPHGTAVVNSGTSITYTPDPGYVGADSFQYTVADGHNGTASARVSVLVRSSINHAPVAVADTFTVSDRATSVVDGINALRPSANDYDADGDVLTITAKTNPGHGTATIVGGNIIEYQPTTGYTGSDSFSYTISDGRGGTANAAIGLTIGNTNPFARPDSIKVAKNASIAFDPRLNDSDPNGDAISVTSVTQGGKGVATLNGDQTITYVANAGAVGGDTFTYGLSDGRGGLATGFVTVSISPNGAPTAKADNISASSSPVTFDPRANDTDAENDALTVTDVSSPANGTAQIINNGTAVVYTANGGYSGADSFTYTVRDTQGGTGTAAVAVNALSVEYLVVGGGGAGKLGGGGGGSVKTGALTLPASSALTVTIGAGGSIGGVGVPGGSGGTTSLQSVSAPGGGGGGWTTGATGSSGGGGGNASAAGGSGTSGEGYPGGAAGTAYTAGGGGGAGSPGANGSYNGSQLTGAGGAGGSGITSDISGASINYAAGGGGKGYVYDEEEGIIFAGGPAGGASAVAGSTGSAPAAAPANRGGGGAGGGGGGTGGSGIVIARYLGGQKATGGTITQVNGYTIHTFNGNGTLTVTTANTAPTAANDSVSVTPLGVVSFDPRANDTDSTDTLTITSVTTPSSGIATITGGGTGITYQPTTGQTGSDSFTYVVSDGAGGTATATVNVSIVTPPTVTLAVMQPGTYASAVTISGLTYEVPSNNSVNVYLDQPISSGKVYWELKLSCGIVQSGVTTSTSSVYAYGGYSSNNAGINSWVGSGWGGSSGSTSVGAANDVYGFALDVSTKVLRIYKNNALGPTINLSPNGPYYPHSGVQPGYTITGQSCGATPSKATFQIGGSTTYSPPTGYVPYGG